MSQSSATTLYNLREASCSLTLMATPPSTQNSPAIVDHVHDEGYEETNQKYLDLVRELPRERGWWSTEHIHQYQGFWFPRAILQGLLILQHKFQANPEDVLLVSYPKSGTTWLKALIFTIMNRTSIDHLTNPLLKSNPHELVALLEVYAIENPTNPRPPTSLMNSHIPYTSLPESIKASGCRIVYVFRDPKDVLVSYWHFVQKLRPKELQPFSLAEAFDQFSRGASPYGPYWDHALGYWRASIECPERVFLLRYEDLKKEPHIHVKRLADFIGHAFSSEEENAGLISKVVEFCSFENLSNLEVNKTGTYSPAALSTIENKFFFRQGKVGDSKNHLSKEMMDLLDQITDQKFKESNLNTSLCLRDETLI